MCMEDERIGRKLFSAGFTQPVAVGANQPLFEVDPLRVRIVISTAGGAIVWVGPRNLPVALNQGFTLSVASPVLVIDIKTWGELVQAAWDARIAAGTEILSVVLSTLGEL